MEFHDYKPPSDEAFEGYRAASLTRQNCGDVFSKLSSQSQVGPRSRQQHVRILLVSGSTLPLVLPVFSISLFSHSPITPLAYDAASNVTHPTVDERLNKLGFLQKIIQVYSSFPWFSSTLHHAF